MFEKPQVTVIGTFPAKTLQGYAIALALILGWPGMASADLVADFEGTGLLEGSVITTEIAGLTISGGKLVREGSPKHSFGSFAACFAPDTVCTGACFDHDFLAPTTSGRSHVISIDFDSPVSHLAFTLGDTYRAAVMPSAYFIYRALITDLALLLRLTNWIVSLQVIVMFTSIVYQTLYFMNTGVFLLGGTSISMFLFAHLLVRLTWGAKRGNSFGLKLLFATVFVGVVLSFKRALWMSVGVIMVWYAFWNARYLRVTKRFAGGLFTIVLLFGFGFGASPILFGEVSRQVLDRVGGTFGGGRISIDQLDTSGTHRLAEFTDSWRYMLSAQHPARIMNLIFGMGNAMSRGGIEKD